MLIAHVLIYLELKSNKSAKNTRVRSWLLSAAGDYYKQTNKVVYIDFFIAKMSHSYSSGSVSDSKL